MRILSIGGTRPQFVKMAAITRAFEEHNRSNGAQQVDHRLLHTGQHYDPSMSEVFFHELGLSEPMRLLGIPSATPGMQTAAMLASIEASLLKWKPDAIIVYGDTNSTLAATLAAVKLHIPTVHLEAGLRSHNRCMQEEINRIVSDHVADLLLCPTPSAREQLAQEGLAGRATVVGDVMLDAVLAHAQRPDLAQRRKRMGVRTSRYALATIHRAETTNNATRLGGVVRALAQSPIPVILPMHPRLRTVLGDEGIRQLTAQHRVSVIDPIGYFDMLALESGASLILTDSGGVQKEAFFLGVPCLTMRDETEWEETLEGGWNSLVGTKPEVILAGIEGVLRDRRNGVHAGRSLMAFGDGKASQKSVESILSFVREGTCAPS